MENRLFEIEKRLTYLESYIDDLNSLVIDQQRQLDLCHKTIKALSGKLPDSSPIDPDGSHDERPPHY